MNNYLENIYGILFEPVKTFRTIDTSKPYKFPLVCLIISSMFLLLLTNKDFSFGILFSKIVSVLIYWLFFAFFVNLIAIIFNIKGYYNKLLSLMAFSFVPWLFLAPLKMFTAFEGIVNYICTIFLFGIWVWTISLQVLAISETYNIPRKNAILLYLIPFLGSIIYVTWFIDFCVKLFQFSGF